MSSNNPNILVRLVLSSLFAGEGREKKRQRNFPKVTQLVRGRAGTGMQSSSGACAQKAAAAFCWSCWNVLIYIYIHTYTYIYIYLHGLQHTRLSCPSLPPRVCSNSCPLIRWWHFILCCPLLLLPSIFPSTGVFSNELALCIRWPKQWSFSFGISHSTEYLGAL